MFKVTYFFDYLDPNPTIDYFENRIDAEDFVSEEIQRKVQFQVDHSSKTISDLEYDILVEGESALVHIEEINMVDAQ